jgi:hypothetical protein
VFLAKREGAADPGERDPATLERLRRPTGRADATTEAAPAPAGGVMASAQPSEAEPA